MYALIKGFMFNPDSGCLYHPNGYDTSWLTLRENKWVPEEWACPFEPNFAERLLNQINEMYVDSSCPA